jgi:hypothetical protein
MVNELREGILLQGKVTNWTIDAIKEYKKKFPAAHILLSTWTTEDVSNVPCEVIQSEPPKPTFPHVSNINHQIIGAQVGLRIINADIILKCKTDQIIHNRKIFEIYKGSCFPNKIMITNLNTYLADYRASDFCQIGTKEILLQFWNSVQFYDGSYPVAPETYLTKNYVINVKNDNRSWRDVVDEYFCIKDFHLDFKIEFEKFEIDEKKQTWFEKDRFSKYDLD